MQHDGCMTTDATGPLQRGHRPMTAQTQQPRDAVSTDRIEKRVELRATRSRVWRAIADATQFATWFGVKLDSAFVAGVTTRGHITKPGYEHLKIEMQVQ